MDWPKQLSNRFKLDAADGQPFVSVQSVWSELLTGSSWSHVDCPGYKRPLSSLNSCDVLSEDELLEPCLSAGSDSAKSIVINMPLLKPRPPARLWLADGSLPLQTTVSPEKLALSPPYESYRAKPFASPAEALIDLTESVKACLANEKQRLDCALHLMRHNSWQSAFIRLTVFDTLPHLLGPDYLSCQHRLVWPLIKSFLCELDQVLENIFQISKESSKCVLSTFTHTACRARLNLNHLLASAGLCRLRNNHRYEQSLLSQRLQAVQAVYSRKQGGNDVGLPVVSLTKRFDTATTFAASPIYGAIYLNRQDRFADGIIASKDEDSILHETQDYLKSTLSREFGPEDFVFSVKRKTDRKSFSGPELIVSIAGVDLHDASHTRGIDHDYHPRSTHNYHGFVWLSNTEKRKSQQIKTTEVYRYLMGQPLG